MWFICHHKWWFLNPKHCFHVEKLYQFTWILGQFSRLYTGNKMNHISKTCSFLNQICRYSYWTLRAFLKYWDVDVGDDQLLYSMLFPDSPISTSLSYSLFNWITPFKDWWISNYCRVSKSPQDSTLLTPNLHFLTSMLVSWLSWSRLIWAVLIYRPARDLCSRVGLMGQHNGAAALYASLFLLPGSSWGMSFSGDGRCARV